MAEHFAASARMRSALVAGDLDGFRSSADTLDKELSANLNETWKQHLDAMRSAARTARDAKTIDAAAVALGDVGAACAACHEKLGPPKMSVGAPPAPASGAKPHMDRHHWAADRLWDGLVGPSREAWSKGAEVLADAPLAPAAIAGQKSVPPEVLDLAKRTHALASRARTANDDRARAKSVAEVYETCAGCHGKLGVAPR